MNENSLFWLLQLLGRLHPLVVHFPIGLIIVAFFMELFTITGKREGLREGINWMVYIGAVFSILAALLGWFLATSDDYTGDLVSLHQNLGIVTAILASVTALILSHISKSKNPNYKFYRTCLLITVGFLSITGHLGANLTHGENFLTEVLPGNKTSYDDTKAVTLLTKLNPLDSLTEAHLDDLNLEVRAILAHNCYQCHSENKQKGKLVLDNKRGVFKGGENGTIILAGFPEKSELYRRITLSPNHDEVMPKKGKVLKDSEIELIRLWIEKGAHWADKALKVFPEAALALSKPKLPESTSENHPVDKIVYHYFKANNIKPPTVVDDKTFIRRVYLDVIGLLPTIDEVNDFVRNKDFNKREKLVDKLLSDDTNYTQNWLTFWNDLLRNDYSGTGFITGGRRQITDWLYQSLMDNKPYDEMVKQLVNPTDRSIGFIKGIKWRGVVNASQRTEMQAAQNIGQAFMGMNVKCASCHNSFVSNLTLDQAYGFATVFSDSILELNRCDKPIGKMAEVNFLYPELGSVDAPTVKERLEKLSNIMVKPENGRLYRTITNRIWKRLMGRGIIEPVDEMDNTPWNSDLLDWLSAEFIESNYNLKALLRTIITSKVYQQSSINYSDITEVKTDKYKFQGPIIRRLNAEQFSDAVSQIVSPVYYALAYNPTKGQLSNNRIWHREVKFERDVLPEPGKRYFRYQFNLEKVDVKSAEVLVSVDNSYVLYLNGKQISEGKDWKKVKKIDVKNQLVKGQNVVAIEAVNESNIPKPAGVLFALKIINQTGEEFLIKSNSKWKSTDKNPDKNWFLLNYDDSDWSNAKNFGTKHWGSLINFTFDSVQSNFARASLVKQHSFLKALGRPSRENIATSRDNEATLLQALELTNGNFFNNVLKEGAYTWLETYGTDSEKIVDTLYLKAFGREPSIKEKRTMLGLLGKEPNIDGVQDLFWATLLLPEFQFIY